MPRADRVPSTPCAVARPETIFESHPSRRAWLGGAVSALAGTTIAAAARPAKARAAGPTLLEIENELRLCQLAEAVMKQQELADRHDDEVAELAEIWIGEMDRLRDDLARTCWDEHRFPTDEEKQTNRQKIASMPETRRHGELLDLSVPHIEEADRLIREMWTIPATTERGRDAKLRVFFGSTAPFGWCLNDDKADYEIVMIRKLLFEFAGPAGAAWFKRFNRANRPAGMIGEGV